MNMNARTSLSSAALLKHARRQAYISALLQPESVILLAFAMLMSGLSLLRIFWFPQWWWAWLVFGIAGAGVLAWSITRDEAFKQKVVIKLFYGHLNHDRLHLPDLKISVAQALDYHRLLFRAIADRPHAPLAAIAVDMDELVTRIYEVACMLDKFVSNDKIHQYLLGAMQEKMERVETATQGYQTIEEFTTALMPLKNTAETSNEKAQLLETVCLVVNQAHTQLRDTLINISAVHNKVSSSITWQGDWAFVEVAHSSFETYAKTLAAQAIALDDLFTSCSLAATRMSA